MRVVFDTSVLIRMVVSRGGLLQLKLLASSGLIVITSEYLLSELERTLHSRLGATKQRAHATSRAVAKLAQIVSPTDIPKINRDPADDPVIAAVLVGKAELLVSADKDLLDFDTAGKFRTITYDEFLEKFLG